MAKRVLVETPDLLFRSKLAAAVTAAGGEVTRDPAACDLVVVDLGPPDAMERIRNFVARGVPVVAHGSHVRTAALRAARQAGATAVPNSQVEEKLREVLRGSGPQV